MKQFIREKLSFGEYYYPHADKLNPSLFSFISSLPIDIPYTGGKKDIRNLTRWVLNEKMNVYNKDIDTLITWIYGIIKKDFYIINQFALREVWGLIYNKGDSQHSHCHPPFLYTFCYYVNTPKGSSPLVLSTSKRKIKPEPGKLLIFDARIFHEIPPNQCDSRCLVCGNFM